MSVSTLPIAHTSNLVSYLKSLTLLYCKGLGSEVKITSQSTPVNFNDIIEALQKSPTHQKVLDCAQALFPEIARS